jgi:hypothetical protein
MTGATYAAAGGSAAGFAIFDAFSRRWEKKYDAAAAAARWKAYSTCPPGRIGADALFALADKADPNWLNKAMINAFGATPMEATYTPNGDAGNNDNNHASSDNSHSTSNNGSGAHSGSSGNGASSGASGSGGTSGTGGSAGSGNKAGSTGHNKQKPGAASPYIICKLEGIAMEPTRWLWRGDLPLGALEITAGGFGIGKGLVVCDFAARITTGRAWPDGTPGCEPGSVVILSAEDGAADYARRLEAAGADRRRTVTLESVRRNGRNELFLLASDLGKLEQLCRELGNTRLVNHRPDHRLYGQRQRLRLAPGNRCARTAPSAEGNRGAPRHCLLPAHTSTQRCRRTPGG